MTFTVYRANLSKMQRPQAQKICDKMYPGCRVISFHESDATDGPVVLTMESKDCGEGKYYCREDKKCKPIPMGYHEREDGYLVKNETYFYAGDSKEEFKDKAKKKKENEMKVKKEDTVVLTKAADEKKKKKKKTGQEGATDVPNFPQDQVSEDWQKKIR